MVCINASIVTKGGKVLVSRSFLPITKVRLSALLAAFPKLIGSGKQHTYVESDSVRYVYLPLDDLYIVLITDQRSNIIEDLSILQLLSKVVPEQLLVHEITEDSIVKRQFEIAFAFDEAITYGGYKECVHLQQVLTNLEMESHEEKLAMMLKQSKEDEAKEKAKQMAKQLEEKKIERMRAQKLQGSGSGGSSGFGSRDSNMGSGRSGDSYKPPPKPERKERPERKDTRPPPGKGLQLGKTKKTDDIMKQLKAEGAVVDTPERSVASTTAAAAPAKSSDPIQVTVDEKLTIQLNKDGGLEHMEVKGDISLCVSDPSMATIVVQLSQGDNSKFQFKTHPNINKALFNEQSMLGLKDPSRPFPVNSVLGVLKWRCQSKDEADIPITVTCWPSTSGSESQVNLEYELQRDDMRLQDVEIRIPLPGCRTQPSVSNVDGDLRFDSREECAIWAIDIVDKTNKNGSVEFTVPAINEADFFPVEVNFTSFNTLCDIKVDGIFQASGPQTDALKYGLQALLTSDEYLIS
eukprot:Rmarinus@m.10365